MPAAARRARGARCRRGPEPRSISAHSMAGTTFSSTSETKRLASAPFSPFWVSSRTRRFTSATASQRAATIAQPAACARRCGWRARTRLLFLCIALSRPSATTGAAPRRAWWARQARCALSCPHPRRRQRPPPQGRCGLRRGSPCRRRASFLCRHCRRAAVEVAAKAAGTAAAAATAAEVAAAEEEEEEEEEAAAAAVAQRRPQASGRPNRRFPRQWLALASARAAAARRLRSTARQTRDRLTCSARRSAVAGTRMAASRSPRSATAPI